MRPGRFTSFRSFLASLAVHVVALLLLTVSLQLDRPGTPPTVQADTKIVEAVAVDQSKVEAELQRIRDAEKRKREVEESRQRELQRKAEALKKERQDEQQRLAQLREEQKAIEKQKNAEQQKLKEAAEKRKLEEEKQAKLGEENAKVMVEQKRLAEERRLEEKKRKQEEEKQLAEKKNREAEEKARVEAAQALEEKKRNQEQQRRDRELKQGLAEEERARVDAQQQERDEAEIDRYIKAIRHSVENSFINPVKGLKCIISVRTVLGGEVVDATVVHSSGNATFDRQAEVAVRKASPLPVPADPRLFNQQFREFRFEFAPRG